MASKPPPHDDVSHLLAVMQEVHAPGHSPLYVWMRKRHDKLAEGLDGVRPSWVALAGRLREMGILDGKGQAPSPGVVRNTWFRVRRDLAAARSRRKKTPAPVLAPSEIAPAVQAEVAPAATEAATVAPRMKLDIRPARALVDSPIPPSPAVAAASALTTEQTAEAGQAHEDARDQIQLVMAAMAAKNSPMPQIVPPVSNTTLRKT